MLVLVPVGKVDTAIAITTFVPVHAVSNGSVGVYFTLRVYMSPLGTFYAHCIKRNVEENQLSPEPI